MRGTRKLVLKRERLVQLTTEDLQAVAGGLYLTGNYPTIVIRDDTVYCVTVTCTGTQGCPSDGGNCSTVDGTCSCGCTYRDICGNAAIA